MERSCPREGCGLPLRFPEEFESERCAVCAAKDEGHPRQNPNRMALIPGLLEIFEIAQEIRMMPGVSERARGRAERLREIVTQLLQNRRIGVFNKATLEAQLQYLLNGVASLTDLSSSFVPIEELPSGHLEVSRESGSCATGTYAFKGRIKRNPHA